MNIVVVGAGIVGCAVAHELASRGARVEVVDARGTAGGATRASAGMLAPHIEGHMAALHALGVRSLALYDRFVARAAEDSGRPIEYERTGTLQVALDAAEAERLCDAARALASAGVAHAILDGPEARRQEPSLDGRVTAALHVPDQGYVAAAALTHALAAAAARRGARFTTAAVQAIDGGETPRVVTSGGSLSADRVVIAAGSWSCSLGSPPRDAVRPIRGQIVELGLPSRAATRIVWGSRCYLVPWRDGTTLVGATVEDVGFDETPTAVAVQQLLAASAELIPTLGAAAFREVRVGLRPMTADELPAVGPSSTMRHVVYATGHYRNGVLLAPLTAALVADLLLEGREGAELDLVRPARLGL